MIDIKPGWHLNPCSACGEMASSTSHFGGKAKIENCPCQIPQLCLECFMKTPEASYD